MTMRRFQRIALTTQGDLIHHSLNYRVSLENLSLRGALVSANECLMIPDGERCTLSLCLKKGEVPLVLVAEVAHSFFSIIGIKFIAFVGGGESQLFEFLMTISGDKDALRREWEEIQAARMGREDGRPFPSTVTKAETGEARQADQLPPR